MTEATQLEKLDALIDAATKARRAAGMNLMFCTLSGQRLTNAAYDLFQVDGLYDLVGEIAWERRHDREGYPIGDDGERIWSVAS